MKTRGETILATDFPSKEKGLTPTTLIRTTFVMVWTVLVTVIFAIVAIILSIFDGSGNLPHIAARIWAKSILVGSRINVTVRGLSNIDTSKSYIYMSNHQSNFDIPVLLAHLKVQFRWLAKAELFRIPLFGTSMKRVGYISIDRSDRRAAFASLKRAAEIIRGGISVLIFPEGTRSRDGNIRPFKKGGFVLAVDSQVPIVPVIVHGTWPIMPRDRLRIESGSVVVEIAEPIETAHYTRKTTDDLMEKVRDTICEAFERGKTDRPWC